MAAKKGSKKSVVRSIGSGCGSGDAYSRTVAICHSPVAIKRDATKIYDSNDFTRGTGRLLRNLTESFDRPNYQPVVDLTTAC